jgi:thiamine-monophosphate kinase
MAPSTRSPAMHEPDEDDDWFADEAPSEATAPPATNEFDHIARLLRPLTRGDPVALDLLDDAAVLPSRPDHDLVITKDAMVAGVHFLAEESLDVVARRLLRTNLSDLAAKGAEPYGYFLAVGWPSGSDVTSRETFARGLAEDGAAFDISLLGGDTFTTSGPFVVSATFLGWVPSGAAVLRRGAKPGDKLMVSGTIGDGWLGLMAQWGEVMDEDSSLLRRYRQPEPRIGLRDALRAHAHAAADVSDGLLADSGHLAKASGCRVRVDLERLPLSPGAAAWLGNPAGRLGSSPGPGLGWRRLRDRLRGRSGRRLGLPRRRRRRRDQGQRDRRVRRGRGRDGLLQAQGRHPDQAGLAARLRKLQGFLVKERS